MATYPSRATAPADDTGERLNASPQATLRTKEIAVTLLTGGFDRPYAYGLSMALAAQGMILDVIGSNEVDSPEMHTTPNLSFRNFHGAKQEASFADKVWRVLRYYARLSRYTATSSPRIFHILWNGKFQYFDRTLLMLYYRLCGKKIVLTAHNVNAGKRDGNDSLANRMTLRIQYRLAQHIFVHTKSMGEELSSDFGVPARKISVIPFGINNSVPDTKLTAPEAKRRIGVREDEKTILFFGGIRPYKGLEYLVAAFLQIAPGHPEYRLVIAGALKKGYEDYWNEIQQKIAAHSCGNQVIQKIEYIPDEETEVYFKAADVLALPYTHIFQSGVLFLAYSFGLPVVATDVGAIREDMIAGSTGFLCPPSDAAGLAGALETYFSSDLFEHLPGRRQEIRDYANARHSWSVVGDITNRVYTELLGSSV
jgi:glycosyltransferase involved in cell wall biosynthesis